MRPHLIRVTCCVVAAMTCAVEARGERLAIRTYTTADGLGSSVVLHIHTDSRGFLWLATRNGLSRFDGTEFRSYGGEDGLVQPVINFVLETRDEGLWVATNGGGVCRFNADATALPRFACITVGDDFLSNRVNVMHQDRRGRIWLGTDRRLFHLERDGTTWRARPVTVPGGAGLTVSTSVIHEDDAGRVWVGVLDGLLRIDPDDRMTLYRLSGRDAQPPRAIVARDGIVWIGYRFGLIGFRPPQELGTVGDLPRVMVATSSSCFPASEGHVLRELRVDEACLVELPPDLASPHVRSLLRDGSNRIWVGLTGALGVIGRDTFSIRRAGEQLGTDPPRALAQDREGHLWLATAIGAMKLAPDGVISFGPADGLVQTRVQHVLEHPDHGVVAISADWVINRFDGTRFRATTLGATAGAFSYYSHGALVDRRGRWWLLTERGVLRLRPATTIDDAVKQLPEAAFTAADGVASTFVARAFEDSRGDLWLASRTQGSPNVSRWNRATDRVESLAAVFGSRHLLPMAFAEDRRGAVWIGFEGGQLARYADGRITMFDIAHGVPASVTSLFVDRADALWIGSASEGIVVLRDLAADAPQFDHLTTADGLSTNNVQCVTEDMWGRLYFGTARGIDRFDPTTRRIRHFSTADGLPSDYVTTAMRGRDGSLWFGTTDGLARLLPTPDTRAMPSPVWIGEVRAAGTPWALPALGAADVAGIALPAGQNHVEIGFFGIGFGTGGPLRYRYRLDSEREWSGPTDRRVVHYARLGPGRYRFLVEAINADGVVSARPASVVFTVEPPFWRRAWFLALTAAVVVAVAYVWHRARVARLIELERVRARIAGDLHDDIGGSLSRIAIQSEVARRDAVDPDGAPAQRLVEIGDTARGVVESLGDVVWSVDPGQDDLGSVERRVREYAAEILGARGVRWTFHPSGTGESVALDPERRRDLLLFLKEGVTNIARHAEARVASLHLRLADGELHAELRDDGRGFDVAAATRGDGGGRGVANMRMRASRLGGRLGVTSAPGAGTTVVLTMPLSSRRRMYMRLWSRQPATDHTVH
jgi:signal transduction histidine kinase/ligand-binding sensor domain-containing protein